MKRTLCLFLALILAVGICFSAPVTITASAAEAVSGTCGASTNTGGESSVTWAYDSVTTTLTISGSGAMADYSGSDMPWNDYKDGITEVVIENGVTTIGNIAFSNCTSLIIVTIPSSVTTIAGNAFEGCDAITIVNVPCIWEGETAGGKTVTKHHDYNDENICTKCGNPGAWFTGTKVNDDFSVTFFVECDDHYFVPWDQLQIEVYNGDQLVEGLGNIAYDVQQGYYATMTELNPDCKGITLTADLIIHGYYNGHEKTSTTVEVKNPNNHSGVLGDPVLTEDGEQHVKKWSCCDAEVTEAHTLDVTTGKCSACGADMTAIATVTDGTSIYYAADAATLNQAVTAILETGSRTFTVELPADAPAEIITAIRRAICDTEGVADGSINLTLKGVTSIPGTTNWDGVAFGPGDIYDEAGKIVDQELVTQLASINLPDVTEIGAQAFYFCENLVSVSAPKAQTIGAQALGYTALTSVEFPELTTIPTDMFSGTWTLSSAKFPKVTTIEQGGLLVGAKFTPENNPTPFPLELTAEGDITFNGSYHFNIAERNYTGKVDLVLCCDKKDAVTFHDDGTATWQVRNDLNYTFKSITFKHSYVDGKCESCGEDCAHTGGTATCTTLAVCDTCGVSYGKVDTTNHDETVAFDSNGFCPNGCYEPATLNAAGYYEIDNAGKLFWFAQQVNVKGNREIKGVLTADIDLEDKPWTPIGETGEENNNFCGVFDGQGHTIRGLNVEGSENGVGFFGEVRTGTVKNFTIYGNVVVNTEVDYVGGVIGSICGLNGENDLERNGAIIQNITSFVNVTAKAHGIGMIGGFVGYANHQSLIEQCAWYGTFDTGEYRVDSGAGGFIGKIQENTSEVTIRNCGAYGTIKTNYAKNSYNNYTTIYMGGFLSFSNMGAQTTLENCLFAGKFERGANLTDQAFLGSFGTLRSVNAIKNCYYLGDDGLEAVHSDSDLKPGSDNVEITSVTGEELRNNTIATQLGEYWTQGIHYPILNEGQTWHGDSATYTYTDNGDGTHDKVCNECGYVEVDNEDHSFDESEYCEFCEYQCPHPNYTNGRCDVCACYCPHTNTEPVYNSYEDNTNQHYKHYECCGVDEWAGYHNDENGDTKCDQCNVQLVVKVHLRPATSMGIRNGDNYFTSLENAIEKANEILDGGDLILLSDAVINSEKALTIDKNKLDTNGKKLTVNGTLVLPDSEYTGATIPTGVVGSGTVKIGENFFKLADNGKWCCAEESQHTSSVQTCVGYLCELCGNYYGEANDNHDIVTDKAVEATCTKTGLTEGQHCTRCDAMTIIQEEVPARNHKDTLVQVEAKAKTCTTVGWEAYEYCTACDYTTKVEIPASHEIVEVNAKAKTCTEAGHNAHEYCTECDYTTKVVIPASHELQEVKAKAPTCEAIGWDAYEYCTACDYTTYKEKAKLGHNIVIDKAVAPTCTKTGLTEGQHCTRCDDKTVAQQTIAKKAHTEVTVTGKAATCTATGLTDGKKCSVCGVTTVEQQTIATKAHTEVTVTGKAATCTATGLTDGKKCSVCGVTTVAQQTIAKKGHTEVTVTGKAATCTATGLTDGKKCSVCGATTVAQQTIAKKGHTEVTVTGKAATCTASGLTDGKKCSVCGTVTKAQETIKATGHTTSVINKKDATCTVDGYTGDTYCSVCKTTTVKGTVVKATGHKEVVIPEVAPTYTTVGKTEGKKCSVCGTITVAQKDVAKLTLAVPTVTIKNTAKGINVSWNKVNGAESYIVYRRTYNEKTKKWSSWSRLKTGVTATSYTDTTVKLGTKYRYTVKSVNGDVASKYISTSTLKYNVAPTVKVANASNGVKVSWSTVANATGYTVYSSTYNTKTKKWSGWKNRGTAKATATSWVDKNATKSGAYYKYTVRACNGKDIKSSYNKDGVKTLFLATPTVKIANNAKGVKVTWNKITGSKGYIIYRSEINNGKWSNWKNMGTVKNTILSWVDKNAQSGTTYRYTVRAVNGNYKSAYKASGSLIFLSQPTVKVANASNGIKVSWNKVDGITGYTVYSSTYDAKTKKWSSWKNRGTAKANKTSWVDKNVKSGVKYKYTVRAVNGKTKSTYVSSSALLYLAQPTVTVKAISNGINVSWTQCAGSNGYTVYRSELVNGEWSNWTNMGTAKSNKKSWTDKKAKKGVTYKYTVRAVNGKVKSSYKSSSSITK